MIWTTAANTLSATPVISRTQLRREARAVFPAERFNSVPIPPPVRKIGTIPGQSAPAGILLLCQSPVLLPLCRSHLGMRRIFVRMPSLRNRREEGGRVQGSTFAHRSSRGTPRRTTSVRFAHQWWRSVSHPSIPRGTPIWHGRAPPSRNSLLHCQGSPCQQPTPRQSRKSACRPSFTDARVRL